MCGCSSSNKPLPKILIIGDSISGGYFPYVKKNLTGKAELFQAISYDENGNSTGTFTGNETALSFGYAFQIGFSDFYSGVNIKLISSKLEQYTSLGGALDFGLIYINEYLEFNAALAIRNLGAQFTTYAGLNEPLPFEIDLGFSQKLKNVPIRWHLTFENL